MLFSVSGSFTHVRFPDDEQLTVSLPGPPAVVIGFSHQALVSNPDLKRADDTGPESPIEQVAWTRTPGPVLPPMIDLAVALCVAKREAEPPDTILRALEAMQDGRVPVGSSVPVGWSDIGQDGRILPGHTLPMKFLPGDFQAWMLDIYRSLIEPANKLFHVLNWRYNARLAHRAIAFDGFRWSLDGAEWIDLPHMAELVLLQQNAIMPPWQTSSEEILPLLVNNQEPSLGHELLDEARELHQSSPRRSLVIGVSAAEVGFKQWAAEKAPDAAWLIEAAPSPPLARMLRDYLPILLAADSRYAIKALPRRHVIKPITDAVEARNTIIHKSATAVADHESAARLLCSQPLSRILDAVSDLIWFLDYYRGLDWALDHVRPAAVTKWRQPTG